MELRGKTALITGSAVRIGRAMALSLAKEGCNLILHYNASSEKVKILQSEVKELGIEAITIQANLMNSDETEALIPHCLDLTQQIDILINNAGIYKNATGMNSSHEIWDMQFALNLRAPFLLTQSFAKHLPKGAQGKVVNISDARVFHQQPDHFVYRLTKSALLDMTKMFALELAPDITVNSVALGIMMPLAGLEHIDLNILAERRVPLKRIGSPEIAAENVLHILEQDFMTGTIIRVDGGEFLQ